MNIRSFLLQFKYDRRFDKIIPLLASDEVFRTELINQVSSNEYPFAEYSSWIAQHFFKQHPAFLPEWIPLIKQVLLQTKNHSVQRNLTHVFVNDPFLISEDGELLQLFLSFLESPDALPALKYAAFRSIEKQYFKQYPELIPEVGHLLFLHKEDQRPSIQSIRRYFNKKYKSFAHA